VFRQTVSQYQEAPFASGGGALGASLSVAHVHHGVELGVVIEGHGYLYINGRDIPLGPGDLDFVDASIPHWHYGSDSDGEFNRAWITIPMHSIVSLIPGTSDSRLFLPFVALRRGVHPVLRGANQIGERIAHAHRLHRTRSRDWQLESWKEIVAALADLYLTLRPQLDTMVPPLSPGALSNIMPALDYLERAYAEPVPVDHLAALCNLSPSRFSHVFSEVMGLSPIRYRNHLRVNHAVERLLGSSDSLRTIALSCGFQSLSQFRDTFTRVTNTTPGAFRRGKAGRHAEAGGRRTA